MKPLPELSRRLGKSTELCLVLLKFAVNVNDAIMAAEIVHTIFKFWGVTIMSSVVVWGFGPLFYTFLSPLYRLVFLSGKHNTFLMIMLSLTLLFFVNSLCFITLFNLENYAAEQQTPADSIIYFAIFSFGLLDFCNNLFESLIFDYMSDFVHRRRAQRFAFYGDLFDKVGKILGAFLCSLYVVFGRTRFSHFSSAFETNMQFTYYFAACSNAACIFLVFLLWPRHFNLQSNPHSARAAGLVELFWPGLPQLKKLTSATKRLLVRLFFIKGFYWFICVSLTYWIAEKFMDDFPQTISNSSIQAIDIGTAWGSISLTIFYCFYGASQLLVLPVISRLQRFGRAFTLSVNLFGFLVYSLCYFLYEWDIKVMIALQGLGGLCFDWLMYEKIRKRVPKDPGLLPLSKEKRKEAASEVFELVEFSASIFFFFVLPVLLWNFSNQFTMLVIAFGLLALALVPPPKDAEL